jgi:hypothetical protein
MKFYTLLIAGILFLSGCSSSTADPKNSSAASSEVADIARETACWGYFNSLQPANINQGTQAERRDIARVIFENSLFSSDPLIVSGATNMLEAMKNEDASAYETGSITFITACQKAGLWG